MFDTPPLPSLPSISAGRGPLVVLCHGVTDCAASLSDLIQRLSDRYRVVAVDSLGHGNARRATEAELADPMGSALVALEHTVSRLVADFGPAVGIGHSMGGALLSRLALRRPELFAALIAEDPAWLTADQSETFGHEIPANLSYQHDIRRDPPSALAANRAEYPSWPEADRPGWLAGKLSMDLDFLAQGDVGYPDWEWVGKLSVPTLVISGDGTDVVLGKTGLEKVRNFANSLITTQLMEGARHCVRRENAEAFQAVIEPFLAEHHPVWDPAEHVHQPGSTPVEGPQPSQTTNFYIDPQLRPMLDDAYYPEWDVAGTRERGAKYETPGFAPDWAELEIAEAGGVPMRCWQVPDPQRVILAIHGGGFTAGKAAYDDVHNADMARRFHAVVVSPEYRLAPEHPFPAGAEDCVTAACFAFSRWKLPAFIYGDSAGGGLAETTTAMLLEHGEVKVSGLIMLEPFLDPSMASRSMRVHHAAHMWNRNKAYHAWQAYLADRDPRELPRLINHAHHPAPPRVLTVVASADILRDEGIDWTTRLVDAGFNAQLHMIAGTFHAGLATEGTRVWEQVAEHISEFLSQ